MRLDQALVARKMAASRSLAQKLIESGSVRVNGSVDRKTHRTVSENESIEIIALVPFVSRGGEKLCGALKTFALDVAELDCLDVGASTGGFTDCLLQNGAARVHCLDVGHNQLHPDLRSHPRVSLTEKFNARFLDSNVLPFAPDLTVMDVSFISQTLVLPAISRVLKPHGALVSLVKPQFELAPSDLRKNGVVKTEALQLIALEKVKNAAREWGFEICGAAESPIQGGDGNREWFLYLRFRQ